MQIVEGNGLNQFRQYAGQKAGNPAGYNDIIGNQVIQNAVQNPRFTSNEGESIESYYHRFLSQSEVDMLPLFIRPRICIQLITLNCMIFLKYNQKERISSNTRNRQIAQPEMNIGQDRQMQMVGGNGRNQFRQYAGQNAGIRLARAEGNAAGQNGNQIRCYNCRGEEAGIQLQAEEYDLMAAAADLDEIKEVNANCILMANL
nr:hypothetical protein [Tanacetum cinerariifolium]